MRGRPTAPFRIGALCLPVPPGDAALSGSGLPLWGCQSASLQKGPPRLPIHWHSGWVAFLLLIGPGRRGLPSLPSQPCPLPSERGDRCPPNPAWLLGAGVGGCISAPVCWQGGGTVDLETIILESCILCMHVRFLPPGLLGAWGGWVLSWVHFLCQLSFTQLYFPSFCLSRLPFASSGPAASFSCTQGRPAGTDADPSSGSWDIGPYGDQGHHRAWHLC